MRYNIKRCLKCYSCLDPYYPGICIRWSKREIELLSKSSRRDYDNAMANVSGGGYHKAGMQDRPSSACYRAMLSPLRGANA
jgi:hypothetical protein